MKIGIISDTHNFFDDKVKHFLAPCDEIWHAGDFGSIGCADEIAEFKPLVGVYGNIDDTKVRISYPKFNFFEREGVSVLMTHIGGYPAHYDREAEKMIREKSPKLFICGHSHILKVINDKQYSLLHINPGAAGNMGFHRVRTAVRIEIQQSTITSLEVGEWNR